MTRSHAPIFWLLFGAGGTLAALFGVAMVWMVGIDMAYGLIVPASAFNYHQMMHAFENPLFRVFVFATTSLLAWHAVHRIFHSLHDLGLQGGLIAKLACYGTALVITIISGVSLLTLGERVMHLS